MPRPTSSTPRLLVLSLLASVCHSWTLPQSPRRLKQGWQRPFRHLEVPDTETSSSSSPFLILPLSKLLQRSLHPQKPPPAATTPVSTSSAPRPKKLPLALTAPWSTSRFTGQPLFFTKVCNAQLQYMQQHLTNLRTVALHPDLQQQENDKYRIHTMAFCSDEYEYIRLTHIDGGQATRVFMSLWYPRAHNDGGGLPTFGTNLLQLGERTVGIVDIQPAVSSSEAPPKQIEYEHLLAPIRNKYPRLQEEMTGRFYKPNGGYCSKQSMLLGRHDTSNSDYDVSELQSQVTAGAQEYMETHVGLVQKHHHASSKRKLPSKQADDDYYADYDTYHQQCDPAHKLLANMFGKEWSDRFVSEVLFRHARSKEEMETQPREMRPER